MTRTVARLLAESLEAHDVDQVYCVPGESYVGLTSALIDDENLGVARIVSHVALRPVRRFTGYPDSLLARKPAKG